MPISVILVALLLVGTSAQCDVSTTGRKECGFYGINQSSCAAKGCCWGPVGAEHHLGVPWCFFKSSPPAPGPNRLPVPLPRCELLTGKEPPLELDAIEYYLTGRFRGGSCLIVGKPGTLIKGDGTAHFIGNPTFGGTLRIQKVFFEGSLNLTGSIDLEAVETDTGFHIRDADVRWNGKGVSKVYYELWGGEIISSTVSLIDFAFQSHPGFFSISASNVSIHNSIISTDHYCPGVYDSRVTLVDSSLLCHEAKYGTLLLDNSVLNLTRSNISSNGRRMLISNSMVHATCNGGVVLDVKNVLGWFDVMPLLNATNSAFYFGNCSCQVNKQFPIHSDGELNLAGSSLNIGECIWPPHNTFVV